MHIGLLEVIIILLVLLTIGGPIWIIFQWVNYYNRKNNNALTIAKERYAKGEISNDEFMTIKKNIS